MAARSRIFDSRIKLLSRGVTTYFITFVFSFLVIILLANRPQNGVILNEPEVHMVPVTEVVLAHKTVQPTVTTTERSDKKSDKKQKQPLKSSIRSEKLQNLEPCDLTADKSEPRVDIQKLMGEFQKCIRPIVKRWKNNTDKINSKWEKTGRCDQVFNGINVVPMKNLHEKNWVILPICVSLEVSPRNPTLFQKDKNILVTLGVGNDTMAEEMLNLTLPGTTFYGADPIDNPKRELYSAFGKFSIGKKPGFTKDSTTIPFSYFLSDILRLERIDFLWIDIDGGEHELLDQLHRGAELDQKKVSICQLNLEIQSKSHTSGARVFHDFVFRVLEEKRFVFMKPKRIGEGVHRMFLVNVEDKRCVRKFLQ